MSRARNGRGAAPDPRGVRRFVLDTIRMLAAVRALRVRSRITVDDPRLEPFCAFLAAKEPCPKRVRVFVHWRHAVVEVPETGEKGFGVYVAGGRVPEIHAAGLAFAGDEDGGVAAVAEIIAHEYAHHLQVCRGEKPDEKAAEKMARAWGEEFFSAGEACGTRESPG
ncbi:MAG: hypothetical protein ACPLRW_06675 [Moorellales bacterium]